MCRSCRSDIATTADFEEEVVVHRRQRLAERQRHRMIVHEQNRHLTTGIRIHAQLDIGEFPWHERSFEFVEGRDQHRPEPVRAQRDV